MTLPYRPLGQLKEMLDGLGMQITYAYEDLVFIQHNHFLLQFGASGEMLYFHGNIETPAEELTHYATIIHTAATAAGFTLLQRGHYRLTTAEDQNLSLEFIDQHAAASGTSHG